MEDFFAEPSQKPQLKVSLTKTTETVQKGLEKDVQMGRLSLIFSDKSVFDRMLKCNLSPYEISF